MRLGHAVLVVNDLDAMLAFYTETLGLRISDVGTGAGRAGTPRIAFLSSDPAACHHQIGLLELPREPSAAANVNHVAFEVDTLDDLRAVWGRVRVDPRAGGLAAAAPVTAFQGDQWSIRFSDPEGNGIEVYAPTPWDAKAASRPYTRRPGYLFEPFDLDCSDDELIAWGAEHMEEVGQEHWPRGERPWPSVRSRR
jgi:catechol 2,3-dioxygenase-like lactoylglutathione lyase family enzyme